MRHGEGRHGESIDERGFGLLQQAGDGAPHAHVSRLEDVEAIDLLHLDQHDVPEHALVRRQFLIDGLAILGREQLGIGEALVLEAVGQDDSGHADGTRQRTAPGFIHARDAIEAALPHGALVPEMRTSGKPGKVFVFAGRFPRHGRESGLATMNTGERSGSKPFQSRSRSVLNAVK